MNGNLAVRQNALKRELVHVRKTTCLSQRQALLAKERHREFPAQLRLGQMGCGQYAIRARDWPGSLTALYRVVSAPLRVPCPHRPPSAKLVAPGAQSRLERTIVTRKVPEQSQ